MGNLMLRVLRPDDLLALTFEFVNLALDTPQGQAPRLVRSQPGQPAFLIVHFAPQHTAEHCSRRAYSVCHSV